MWYGNFEMVVGCMFAGKSTEAVKRITWARDYLKRRVAVFKPAFDDRYSESHIVTHDGVSVPATPIRSWPEIADDVQIVFIDEVQFFERPWFEGDLPEEIRKLLARGIDVFASGLDTDWRGRPFRVTADLLAMADQVTKLRASCAVCNQPATKNFKKIPNDLSVELGKEDKYEVRCNLHWHDHSTGRAD